MCWPPPGRSTFQELSTAAPDPRVVDVFRLKYDYHNAKVLSEGGGHGDRRRGGCSAGRRARRPRLLGWILRDLSKGSWAACPSAFKVRSGRPGRPWLPPTILSWPTWLLDRACYEEMAQPGPGRPGAAFLQGYVRLAVDVANLRAAVRVARMGKGSEFLSQVLLPGGSVSQRTLAAARGEELSALFQNGALAQAAELGTKAARPAGGSLTAFERECDNALTRYLGMPGGCPFGVETVDRAICTPRRRS
ncbi:MAG: V-type ATPase subunit [Lawsonibacter sp.]